MWVRGKVGDIYSTKSLKFWKATQFGVEGWPKLRTAKKQGYSTELDQHNCARAKAHRIEECSSNVLAGGRKRTIFLSTTWELGGTMHTLENVKGQKKNGTAPDQDQFKSQCNSKQELFWWPSAQSQTNYGHTNGVVLRMCVPFYPLHSSHACTDIYLALKARPTRRGE